MTPLVITSVTLGTILIVIGAFFLVKPINAMHFLAGLPRNVWLGRVLTAIAIVWAAFLTFKEHFDIIDRNLWILFIGTPVLFWLIIQYMDELLCARAIGGLFTILPALMLDAAFIENSPSRLFVTCFAYLMAIAGMILIWSPYLMRKALAPCIKDKNSIFKCGIIVFLLGTFYNILAFTVYR